MKQYYIKNFKVDESYILTDYFVYKAGEIRDGNMGKRHLYMTLSDATGDVSSVKWSLTPDEIARLSQLTPGIIVKASGRVKEYNGRLQFQIDEIKPVSDLSSIDKKDLYKAAPEEPSAMFDFIISRINEFQDEDLKKLCLSYYEELKDKLMYYPAAVSLHHAELGGLLYHTKRMIMLGIRACEVYTNLNRDLLITGAALHDIQKIFEIDSDENGIAGKYTFEGNMLGHIVMGVASLTKRCKELAIPDEKRLLISHMILSHHYEPEFGSPKKPLFLEAEMLHYLDIIDARMEIITDATLNLKPGEFSEKVFALDNRRFYKPTL